MKVTRRLAARTGLVVAAGAATWLGGAWELVPTHDRPWIALAAVAVFLILRPLTVGSEKMRRI